MRALGYFGPAQEAAESNWDSVLDTNLKSVFLLSKAVAPGMIERAQRPHHQYRLAGWQERLRRRRNLLRFKMGTSWADGMHGGGSSAIRHSGQRRFARARWRQISRRMQGRIRSKMLQPEDIAHAVEMIVTQAPQSFISEVLLRPTQKP